MEAIVAWTPPESLVVFHVHMYKVPFISQLNFKHMKKGREKLKLSYLKILLLNTVFMLVLKSILKNELQEKATIPFQTH